MNRRGLIGALLAAPALVRPGLLMPVRSPRPEYEASFYDGETLIGTVSLERRYVPFDPRAPSFAYSGGILRFGPFPDDIWERRYSHVVEHRRGEPSSTGPRLYTAGLQWQSDRWQRDYERAECNA